MEKSNFFYSVWAVFDKRDQKQLEKIKKRANATLKGPSFPIHMTISASFKGIEKDLIHKIQVSHNTILKYINESIKRQIIFEEKSKKDRRKVGLIPDGVVGNRTKAEMRSYTGC